MILEVQKYLRGGGTLETLASEYFIKVRPSAALPLVSLNYDQILSKMSEPICQECRGLILETGTWDVASRSFPKFFNYGQIEAHEIDWASARVQEKLDGSLICFYHYQGEWRVATKGTPDASGSVGAESMTFANLVMLTLLEMGTSWGELTTAMLPNKFYSFELTAPENRVIVPYKGRSLTLLAAWDAETLEEESVASLPQLPTPVVKEYPFSGVTLDFLVAVAGGMSALLDEGVVVSDDSHRRIKVKCPAYMMADRVMSRIATPRRKVELILSPQYDDSLTLLPPHVQDELREYEHKIRALAATAQADFDANKDAPTQKDFALAVKDKKHAALLFNMFKGRTVEDSLRSILAEAVVRMIGLKDDPEKTETD
jgi:hypothetical protein